MHSPRPWLELGATRMPSKGDAAVSALLRRRKQAEANPRNPRPILAQLRAGEAVYQAGELPKTRRVSKIHCEPPETVCKTPFA